MNASMKVLALLVLVSSPVAALDDVKGPRDLALTFTSPYDGGSQPYRLYLPSAYDGKTALPMLVALHGTGGDQNKYFDHEGYSGGIYKAEAEKRGVIMLCPLGTDPDGLPTEWRGRAELNVLAAIEDAQKRVRIDPDRIICTGQSMGGTGTTYLCCRYPDLFAAGIPLASTYGHLSLITNLRDVPMFYVQGAKDWPIYAATGPTPITQEMRRLGYNGELWMVPDAPHNTMNISTPRVFEWALRQKRVAHPRHITHRAYFPPHGRAWWVDIQEIEQPGGFAEVDARAEADNHIVARLKNAARVVLRPDPALHDPKTPLHVEINGREVFNAPCDETHEILLTHSGDTWNATTRPRRITPRTDWKNDVIGTVETAPTWEGTPETTLGNWLTDAMRDISGADIAIATKGHFRYENKMRGAPIHDGQTLRLMEMISWLRPLDTALAAFTLKGSELLEIIEMNLVDGPKAEMYLVQVSGCRYRFDRRRPLGSRVVESDIDPAREYRIVCNSAAITRGDTMQLGDRFGKLSYQLLETTLISSAWRYTQKHNGRISAALDGRVAEVAR